MIPVVEHFYSFQGEGRYAGSPSVFIRLGGCNLGCRGFGVETPSAKDSTIMIVGCDSIKAVHHEHFSHQWEKADDLISLLMIHLKGLDFKPDIVITGGEPLLHYENPILVEAIDYFIRRGHRITFESNATIMIDFKKYPIYKEVTFAMSVKLANSGEEKKKRYNPAAIAAIANHTKTSFFKFVLSKEHLCEEEIAEITADLNLPVYCMPMGSTAKALAKNDKAVANFCIQKGYNYVDRMHIRLWDNEEGR
jgi:organic radical activating enzyme